MAATGFAMAPRVEIQCIRKRSDHYDAHARIQGVCGVHAGEWWFMDLDAAIRAVENGTYAFYVNVNNKQIDVIVAAHIGRKYLKTRAESYAPNNLLNLPECPR